jgi:hypothetical protein
MIFSLQAKVPIPFSLFSFSFVGIWWDWSLLFVSNILLAWCFVSASIQENELSKSIDSCNMEAGVVKTWVNFLEDTWQLQSSYNEQKENTTKYVVIMAVHAFTDFLPFVLFTLLYNPFLLCSILCPKNMLIWFSFTFCLVMSWRDAQAIFWSWPNSTFLILRSVVGYMLFKFLVEFLVRTLYR